MQLPESKKFVLIGAPHTTSWDLLFLLLLVYSTGIKLHFVGKASLFRWPLGAIMRRLGGIPVIRDARNNFVSQMAAIFEASEAFILAIAPEGTRKQADYWKTGFYYIALQANVPIALGFIDYRERVVGIGPSFSPSGDICADFLPIQEFYANKTGKNPHRQGAVQLRADIEPGRL